MRKIQVKCLENINTDMLGIMQLYNVQQVVFPLVLYQ